MEITLQEYGNHLKHEELAAASIRKYMLDARQFDTWRGERDISKGLTMEYKAHMQEKEFKPATLHSKIISLNKYLAFMGEDSAAVKNIKVQNQGLSENVLSQNDYDRMLRQANSKGTARDVLMLEALLRTGVRVSELQCFTVEALQAGYMTIDNKGKIRKVAISKNLEKQAKAYIKDEGITGGAIIQNAQGQPLSRNYIYKRIKYLAGQARIKLAKAYPHSIRHLFARNYLARNGNNAAIQLANILGHESLETTRIYVALSIDEARATMD